MNAPDKPNVIALPPLILAAALAIAVLLEWLLPLGLLPPPLSFWPSLIGATIAGIGGVFAVAGIAAFRRAGTNIEPFKPALVLVDAGPYRISRNPMYLGLMALHLAVTLIASLDWGLLTLIGLALVLHHGVVMREEAYLSRKFGQPYKDFLARTRRWI